MLTASRFLLAVALSTGSTYGQRTETPSLSEPEVRFLRLVASDTSSNTVCVLPRDFSLGVENPGKGRLILVKKGRRNRFVMEGTHRVYSLQGQDPGSLTRIDRTVFTGDSHETMPFLRNDTLHAYAGLGRWTRRDFITVFLEDEGGWEVLLRSNGLENGWMPHAYDAEGDRLYVIGSSPVHHTDWKSIYRDSVYMFDFETRRWVSLGAVDSGFPLKPRPVSRETLVAKTSMGDLFRLEDSFLLVDIAGNRTSRPNASWADSLSHILDESGPAAGIHLSDTLHIIGTKESGLHRRIRFSAGDLQPFRQGSVYLPVVDSGPIDLAWLASAAALLSAVWLIARRARSATANRRKQGSSESAIPTTANTEPSSANDETIRQGLEEMRKHLSHMEWGLLTTLAKSTLEGRHLETEDINKAIGVSDKDASLQKSRRSVVIGRINRVFTQCTGRTGDLVVRERDGEEKRRYNYRLDGETAGPLAELGDG